MFISADSKRPIPVYGNRAYCATHSHDRSISNNVWCLNFDETILRHVCYQISLGRSRFQAAVQLLQEKYGRIYRDRKFFLPSRSHLVMITCVKTKLHLSLYCTYWRIVKALTRLTELLPVMCILAIDSCLYCCVLMWQRPSISVAHIHS